MNRHDVERAEYLSVVAFTVATCASLAVLAVCLGVFGRWAGWW